MEPGALHPSACLGCLEGRARHAPRQVPDAGAPHRIPRQRGSVFFEEHSDDLADGSPIAEPSRSSQGRSPDHTPPLQYRHPRARLLKRRRTSVHQTAGTSGTEREPGATDTSGLD
jgi:hypothetical protein